MVKEDIYNLGKSLAKETDRLTKLFPEDQEDVRRFTEDQLLLNKTLPVNDTVISFILPF